jgi:hypothetical protein
LTSLMVVARNEREGTGWEPVRVLTWRKGCTLTGTGIYHLLEECIQR